MTYLLGIKSFSLLVLLAVALAAQPTDATEAIPIEEVEVSALLHNGDLDEFKQELKDKARRLAIERATGTWVTRHQRIEQGIVQHDSIDLQATGDMVSERWLWLPVSNEVVDGVSTARYTLRLQAQVLPLPAPTLPIAAKARLPESTAQFISELEQSWDSTNPPQQRWRNWLQLVIDRMQGDPKLRYDRQLFAELSRMMAENADEASFSAIPDDLAQQYLVRQLVAAAEARMRSLPERRDYAWLAGNDFSAKRAATIERYVRSCRQCDKAHYLQQELQKLQNRELLLNSSVWVGIVALLLLCRSWRRQCLVSGRSGAYSALSVVLISSVFWAPALGYIAWLITPM